MESRGICVVRAVYRNASSYDHPHVKSILGGANRNVFWPFLWFQNALALREIRLWKKSAPQLRFSGARSVDCAYFQSLTRARRSRKMNPNIWRIYDKHRIVKNTILYFIIFLFRFLNGLQIDSPSGNTRNRQISFRRIRAVVPCGTVFYSAPI